MNLSKKGTIISVNKIAARTAEVSIKVPEDFNFIAGQYIWLQVPELKYPDLKGNVRMFSISSSPNKKGQIDLIFRITESGYKKTLVGMAPGSEVIFSGPYGPLRLPEDNLVPIAIIAGGVGVSPFLSMIRFSNENHTEHKITLIYVNANEKEIAYLDELKKIEKENPNFKFYCIYGLLQEKQLKKLLGDLFDKKVVWSVTGTKGFVDLTSKYLVEEGVSLRDVIFEQFYPSSSF